MENVKPKSDKIPRVSMKDFLEKFEPEIRPAILDVRKRDGVAGVAGLKCEVMNSSRFGLLTALIYGPGCTFKTLEEMTERNGGVYITGLPSSASFVYFYTEDKE